jgi:hypothetical protein
LAGVKGLGVEDDVAAEADGFAGAGGVGAARAGLAGVKGLGVEDDVAAEADGFAGAGGVAAAGAGFAGVEGLGTILSCVGATGFGFCCGATIEPSYGNDHTPDSFGASGSCFCPIKSVDRPISAAVAATFSVSPDEASVSRLSHPSSLSATTARSARRYCRSGGRLNTVRADRTKKRIALVSACPVVGGTRRIGRQTSCYHALSAIGRGVD